MYGTHKHTNNQMEMEMEYNSHIIIEWLLAWSLT